MTYSGRVYVYRNLNTGTWSVRALSGENRGRVIAHPTTLMLRDAAFHVSAKGRDRVRATGVRSVHAGVSGYITRSCASESHDARRVTYNPYRHDSFVDVDTGVAVLTGDLVLFPKQPRNGSVPLMAWQCGRTE